jgi:hypothetical protein
MKPWRGVPPCRVPSCHHDSKCCRTIFKKRSQFPILISWADDKSSEGVEVDAESGTETPTDSVVMFDRGLSFPIVRRVTLRRSGTFIVKSKYDDAALKYGYPILPLKRKRRVTTKTRSVSMSSKTFTVLASTTRLLSTALAFVRDAGIFGRFHTVSIRGSPTTVDLYMTRHLRSSEPNKS